jgi:hypothetical protein
MRDLDLMAQYLLKLRQEKLQVAHKLALQEGSTSLSIKVTAHEAELCSRIMGALKVLTNDSGKFIREFLSEQSE